METMTALLQFAALAVTGVGAVLSFLLLRDPPH